MDKGFVGITDTLPGLPLLLWYLSASCFVVLSKSLFML
ncbi:putative membrane protein [Wolbachia endosymbiont of Trichogramma pretiosum]|nr:putative membrane protein [Wolbachia endosymbiont of Trichogramma pretiosum]